MYHLSSIIYVSSLSMYTSCTSLHMRLFQRMAEKITVRWTTHGGDGRLVARLPGATGCIDSHYHLDLLFRQDGGPRCRTLSAYKQRVGEFQNFAGCVTIFGDPRRWTNTFEWTSILGEPGVCGAIGCHPHQANYFSPESYKLLSENISLDQSMKAIGEIGLDYSSNNHVSWDVQKKVFSHQLELAVEMEKPIVLHIREAERDAHEIIERYVPRGHIMHSHCVTGDAQVHQM